MAYLQASWSGYIILLLVLLVTAVDLSRGATPPTLSAASLSPNTAPNLTAYFAEGEATSPLLTGLPSCVIFAQNGSFLELYNVDTGFVAGRHGPFDNRPGIGSLASTGVLWNTTANPVLDTSYTGLYRCRADTSTSSGFYQLNVRAALNITCPAAFRTEVTESLTRIVRGFGSLPMRIAHTPAIGSISGMNVASPFSVIWSLNGSLPQLMLGQNVSVTWTVSYVDTACSSVTGQSTAPANCLAVPTSSNCTTYVLLVKNCSDDGVKGINVTVISTSASGTVLDSVGCASGYQLTNQSSVRDVLCQLNGTWTSFPNCTDIDECQGSNLCLDGSTCRNTFGSFECLCASGYQYNSTTDTCTDIIECPGACNNMSACQDTPGSFLCECRRGYSGSGLANESCADIDECQGSNLCLNGSTCRNTFGSFECLCASGLQYDSTTGACTDIDECQGSNLCLDGSTCRNTFGSFECLCASGYQYNSTTSACTVANRVSRSLSGGATAGIVIGSTIIVIAVVVVVVIVWKHKQKRSAIKMATRTSPESDDEELRPTFRSGQRLVRPGGVGYGDNYVPADDDVPPQCRVSPRQPPALSSEDTSTDVQDPSDPPGPPEVPVEDNYNTFICDDLVSNPPPTRAAAVDDYRHDLIGDVYRRVDISTKTNRNGDDYTNGGYSSQIV